MTLVFTLLTMAVLGLVAAVAVGRIGGGLDTPASALPARGLPPGEVAPHAIDELRFTPALRGYRMGEVDAALDRVAEELQRRDLEIEELRRELTRLADVSDALYRGAYGPQYEQQYDQYEQSHGQYRQSYDQQPDETYDTGDVPTTSIDRRRIMYEEG